MTNELAIKILTGDVIGTTEQTHEAINMAVKALSQPERKKGMWIDGMEYVNSHWKVCSICHKSAHDSSGGDNFCPNCGADNRGEQDE